MAVKTKKIYDAARLEGYDLDTLSSPMKNSISRCEERSTDLAKLLYTFRIKNQFTIEYDGKVEKSNIDVLRYKKN